MKKIINTVAKKKWGKEEWIILILAGIFLLIVFFPTDESEKKVQEDDETKSSSETFVSDEENVYKEKMEKQLEDVLKSIDGIDSVHAMITFSSSQEDVVLWENEYTAENTVEEDSQGGQREISLDSTKKSVYSENDGKVNKPYITHTIAPKVEGVLIVVGGNRSGLLRTQIVRAVQALFDVDSHKVVVIKMKE